MIHVTFVRCCLNCIWFLYRTLCLVCLINMISATSSDHLPSFLPLSSLDLPNYSFSTLSHQIGWFWWLWWLRSESSVFFTTIPYRTSAMYNKLILRIKYIHDEGVHKSYYLYGAIIHQILNHRSKTPQLPSSQSQICRFWERWSTRSTFFDPEDQNIW